MGNDPTRPGDRPFESRGYPGFGGTVGKVHATSEPEWPARRRASEGAPNVVVVLVDDLGYSDLGCFGAEIPTPNIDAVADSGVSFTNFHVTPMCSPTRAALMTGCNPHQVGVGFVTHIDPGFPGYASEISESQPTMAEVMRHNGYSTMMLGKWHLTRDSNMSEAGDRSSWPLQRGFDEYYGFLEGLTNLHQPHRLIDGNSVVRVDEYPEDYYLTDDLTDRAVEMIRASRAADPDKPFFMYFAHGAVHAPLHATTSDIAAHHGRYDEGWDVIRERRLSRQKELGLIPADVPLPDTPDDPGYDVPRWDSLSEDERRLYARYMECYAAMVTSVDRSVGRLREALTELGELDNTIIVFTSDNGASKEGGATGTLAYFRDGGTRPPGAANDNVAEALEHFDDIGSADTWPHYPRGWAMTCNTPFQLYKLTTMAGGHQVPMLFSWPDGPSRAPGSFRHEYTHVTDLLPTLVDMLGLDPLTERNGRPALPMAGVSLGGLVDGTAEASGHLEQYYECIGNRAYYRDGWEAVATHGARTPFSEDTWRLFDLRSDPTQLHDVGDEHPELLRELIDAWDEAAWENHVYPLDEGTRLRYFLRPDEDARFSREQRLVAGTPTLDRFRSTKLISGRSFRVVVDLHHRAGDEGVLVAHGGTGAGYLLYVEDGRLCFGQRQFLSMRTIDGGPLPEGARSIVVDVQSPGGGTWDVRLLVDDAEVASGTGFRQFGGFLPFDGIDVGVDTASPVDPDLRRRRGVFRYTGELGAVTYVPGQLAPDAAENLIGQARQLGLAME